MDKKIRGKTPVDDIAQRLGLRAFAVWQTRMVSLGVPKGAWSPNWTARTRSAKARSTSVETVYLKKPGWFDLVANGNFATAPYLLQLRRFATW